MRMSQNRLDTKNPGGYGIVRHCKVKHETGCREPETRWECVQIFETRLKHGLANVIQKTRMHGEIRFGAFERVKGRPGPSP